MADDKQPEERRVSITITIRIESVPASEVAALEEQAFQVGDEWGAQVDINKGAPRGNLPSI